MAKTKKKDFKSDKKIKKEVSGRFDISQETKNSIWGITGFILAILSVLAFTHNSGQAGELFNFFAFFCTIPIK